jgi:hypothetical protein
LGLVPLLQANEAPEATRTMQVNIGKMIRMRFYSTSRSLDSQS